MFTYPIPNKFFLEKGSILVCFIEIYLFQHSAFNYLFTFKHAVFNMYTCVAY